MGVEKTGTTTIQKTLSDNRQRLLEKGILYPASLVRGLYAHVGFTLLGYDDDNIDDIRAVGGLNDKNDLSHARAKVLPALGDEIKQHSPRHIIISDELMSSRLNSETEIMRIKSALSQISNSISIVIYLRDQASLLPSYYSESVRAGEYRPFAIAAPTKGQTVAEAWHARRAQIARLDSSSVQFSDPLPIWFDYKDLLDKWSRVFGVDAMTVRLFGRDYLENGRIMSDFSVALDESCLSELTVAASLNVSASANAVRARQIYNRMFPKFVSGKVAARLRRPLPYGLFTLLKGEPLKLSDAQRDHVQEIFAESNAEVARQYFGRDELFC